MPEIIYVKSENIERLIIDLFERQGVSREHGAMIASNLIDAEMRGVSTHGLTRIPLYFQKFEEGLCDPKAIPEVVVDFGAVAVVDAHNGMGQIASTMAMELAIKKAKEFGIGFTGVRNNCHYGTAGYYALMALNEDCVGISCTNSGTFVAPYGGIEKRLGTNPVAVAIPTKRHRPILLDMATSKVSRGKFIVKMKQGVPVPEDWALDAQGRPTTNAREGFEGILLPLGYKGYGQAVVIDMLTGVLMNSGFGTVVDAPGVFPRVGSNFMAVNIQVFRQLAGFIEDIDDLIDEIRSAKLSPDVKKIYMPGEIEWEIMEDNIAKGGVPLQAFHVKELSEITEKYGLKLQNYL